VVGPKLDPPQPRPQTIPTGVGYVTPPLLGAPITVRITTLWQSGHGWALTMALACRAFPQLGYLSGFVCRFAMRSLIGIFVYLSAGYLRTLAMSPQASSRSGIVRLPCSAYGGGDQSFGVPSEGQGA
jgi:hypothetical protein